MNDKLRTEYEATTGGKALLSEPGRVGMWHSAGYVSWLESEVVRRGVPMNADEPTDFREKLEVDRKTSSSHLVPPLQTWPVDPLALLEAVDAMHEYSLRGDWNEAEIIRQDIHKAINAVVERMAKSDITAKESPC